MTVIMYTWRNDSLGIGELSHTLVIRYILHASEEFYIHAQEHRNIEA